MKYYTVKEIKAIFASMTDEEIIATDTLIDSFGATGTSMCLAIHYGQNSKISAEVPQEYDADTEEFYKHWTEITPALVADMREQVEALDD